MKSQHQVKRPNGIIYFLIYIIFAPILKILFRIRIDRDGLHLPKSGFIVMCNHTSFIDFLFVMLALYPYRFNAVTAKKYFYFKPLHRLLPYMGCIPKSLFDPDMNAVKAMGSVLRRGDHILIFPEGRCSVDGNYAGMNKATGKLVKVYRAPVIGCQIQGAYNCMPFWRDIKKFRLGRVHIQVRTILSEEDVLDQNVDEINHTIDRFFKSEAFSLNRKSLKVFRKYKLTEGLNQILYYCPVCHSEYTLECKGNAIFCTNCSSQATMDAYQKLVPSGRHKGTQEKHLPGSVHEWYRAQVLYEHKHLSEDMEKIVIPVMMKSYGEIGEGIIDAGAGTLSFDAKGWYYEGSYFGNTLSLFFPIDTVPALPFDAGDNFQINANGMYLQFTPENKQSCAKYATLGECAHWRFAQNIQLTAPDDIGFNECNF